MNRLVVQKHFDDFFFESHLSVIRSFLSSAEPLEIDLRSTEWLDLSPCLSLCSLVRTAPNPERLTFRLPSSSNVRNKPLSFLYDWQIIHLLISLGCSVFLKEEEPFPSDPRELIRWGYYPSSFTDRLVLPVTSFTSSDNVDSMTAAISERLDFLFGPYAGEEGIQDGTLSEVLLHEIAANVVDHSRDGRGLIALRVLRHLDEIARPRRETVRQFRKEERFEDLALFYRSYEDCGYVELVVVDDGPGIWATLHETYFSSQQFEDRAESRESFLAHKNWPLTFFRYVVQPETSRFTRLERESQGKAPFTGLAATYRALKELGGLLIFREGQHRVWFAPQEGKDNAIRFLHLDPSHDKLVDLGDFPACAIRILLPLRGSGPGDPMHVIAHSTSAPQLHSDPAFIRISSPGQPSILPIGKQIRVHEVGSVLSSLEPPSLLVLDSRNLPTTKNALFSPLQSLAQYSKAKRCPLVLTHILPRVASRINDVLAYENDLHARRTSPDLAYDPTERPRAVGLGLGIDYRPHWLGILAPSVEKRLSKSMELGRPVDEQTEHILNDAGFIHNATLKVSPATVAKALADVRTPGLLSYLRMSKAWSLAPVELPSGETVSEYVSVFQLLHDRRLWLELSYDIVRELAYFNFDTIVSASVCARAIWSHLQTLVGHWNLTHIPQDVFSARGRWTNETSYHPGRAVLLVDALYSGSRCERVVRWCRREGIPVVGVLAIVDLKPGTRSSILDAPLRSVLAHDVSVAPRTPTRPLLIAEPVCGSFGPRDQLKFPSPSYDPPHSDALFSSEFGRTLIRRERLLKVGHFTNGQRHFQAVLKTKKLLRLKSGLRASIIKEIAASLEGIHCLAYPMDSDIVHIVPDILPLLREPLTSLPITRVKGQDGEYLYTLTPEQLVTVKTARTIACIDDAVCTGSTIHRITSVLRAAGAEAIRAIVVVDYSPPSFRDSLSLLSTPTIGFHFSFASVFRVRSDVYENSEACPLCQRRTVLESYSRHAVLDLLQQYCKDEWTDLGASEAAGETALAQSTHSISLDNVDLLSFLARLDNVQGILDNLDLLRRESDPLVILWYARALGSAHLWLILGAAEQTFIQLINDKLDLLSDSHKGQLVTEIAFWPRDLALAAFPRIVESVRKHLGTGCVYLSLALFAKRLWDSSVPSERDLIQKALESAMKACPPQDRAGKAILQSIRHEIGKLGWQGNDLSRHIHFLATRLMYFSKEHHKLLRDGLIRLTRTLQDRRNDLLGGIEALRESPHVFDLLADVSKRVHYLVQQEEIEDSSKALLSDLARIDTCTKLWLDIVRSPDTVTLSTIANMRKLVLYAQRLLYEEGGSSFIAVKQWLSHHLVPLENVWDSFQGQCTLHAVKLLTRPLRSSPTVTIVQEDAMVEFVAHHLVLNSKHATASDTDTPIVELSFTEPRIGEVVIVFRALGRTADPHSLLAGSSLASVRRVMQEYGGEYRFDIQTAKGFTDHILRFQKGL